MMFSLIKFIIILQTIQIEAGAYIENVNLILTEGVILHLAMEQKWPQ